MLALGSLEMGSGTGSGKSLPVSGLGPHGRSYSMIFGRLVPVLGFKAPGSGYVVNRGLLPLVPDLGLLRHRAC